MEFPSKVIEIAVDELSKLPGVGKKTAIRLAMHILKTSEMEAESLGNSIISLRKDTLFCKNCGNISDDDICKICSSSSRDQQTICVVQDYQDVISIENTNQFFGSYHVIGGLINPMNGIGPDQLNINSLLKRIEKESCKELIFAFSANIEGDTTAFYISRKIPSQKIKISSIARGIPIGSELGYTDEVTLARSLLNRTDFRSITSN